MKRFLHASSLALVSSTVGFAQAPPDPLWIRQFGSPKEDRVEAAATDQQGGCFLAGSTFGTLDGPASHSYDVFLARYDDAGDPLWIRQFGSLIPPNQEGFEHGTSVAADGAGGAFVCGYTDGPLGGPAMGKNDVFAARYDGAGNQLWVWQIGTSETEFANDVCGDSGGGCYVTGETGGDLAGPNQGWADAFLVRLDAGGAPVWARQFGGVLREVGHAVCQDGQGGAFVGGRVATTALDWTTFLARYDGAGNQLWIVTGFGAGPRTTAQDVAPDGAGGVFVAGTTAGSLGGPSAGGDDAFVARFDGGGNLLWIVQFGTPAADFSQGIALDGAGGVYCVGSTEGDLGGSQGPRDAFVARVDGSGNILWVGQYGTPSIEFGMGGFLDVPSGSFFLTGRTEGQFGGPNAGDEDVYVVRMAPECAALGRCSLGERYCDPAQPNSSGGPGVIDATGSPLVDHDALTLIASGLPTHQFGYFLGSQTQGAVQPPNTQGVLCLGGTIVRFSSLAAGSGPAGTFQATLDLGAFPPPYGGAVLSGQTWNFTAWFRDKNPGATSNFTDGVSILFW